MKIVIGFAATATLLLTAQANANDATPRLHPTYAACVTYETTGPMMTGDTTRCHRDYAYEQYEIVNTNISFAGVSQSQNQHTIIVGEWIYAINLQTNTGTKTKNPMYDGLVSALEDSSPEEMTPVFLNAMGMTANGQSKTVAGVNCNVYTSAMMGTVCITDGGLMLEQEFMGTTQIATNVSIGDGGEEEKYSLYQNVPITDGPDLSNGFNLQDLMGQQ